MSAKSKTSIKDKIQRNRTVDLEETRKKVIEQKQKEQKPSATKLAGEAMFLNLNEDKSTNQSTEQLTEQSTSQSTNQSTEQSTSQSTIKPTYIEEKKRKKQKKVGVRIDTDMCKYVESKFGDRGYSKAIDVALRLLKKTEDEFGEEHIKQLMKEFE